MSDMDVQIKITTDTKDAQKNVEGLEKSFTNIELTAQSVADALGKTEQSLNETSGSISDASNQVGDFEGAMATLETSINDASSAMGDGSGSAEDFAKSLDEVEKKAKKLGRDLSTLVTAPIAALAALSLKNVFDLGSVEGSTGKVRSFALAVENMKRTFDEFLMDIGTIIAPAVEKMANALTNALRAFMALDRGTKESIISFAAFAAALGPIILAFSSLTSLGLKLKPIFLTIGSGLSSLSSALLSVPAALAVIGTSLFGMLNLFEDLKKSGVGAVESLLLAFNYLASGFLSKIISPILNGISKLLNGASKAASAIGLSFGKGLASAGDSVGSWAKDLDGQFNQISGDIDNILKSSGKSAADSFTFGLSSKFSEVKNKIGDFFDEATSDSGASLLNSEIGKNTEKHFQELTALRKQYNLDNERLNLEHSQRMAEIDQTSDPAEALQAKIQAEREFLAKRTELQREAADRELQNALIANQAITNVNEKRLADNEARNKNELENQKITNEQMLENTRLLNTQEEELYRIKYEKVKQYADIFSDGLSESFISIAEGSKTLGAALEDFARQFLRQVAAMILRATILKAVMSSIGFTGPTASAPSSGAGYLGASTGFASGGPVIGAGSGTSDSIPAWLSNGEYVIDAKTVSRFGNGFFRGLQSLAKGGVPFSMPSSVPKFADGGLVTGSGQAPQVVIENNGSPKQVSSQEFDPKTAITTVILEDLGKNGPISRGYQNTFGMKRGGFA